MTARPKKTWLTPAMRSEDVEETLAQPACNFKPVPGRPHRPGPSFS